MSQVDRRIIFVFFSHTDLVSESDDKMFLKIEKYTSWGGSLVLRVLLILREDFSQSWVCSFQSMVLVILLLCFLMFFLLYFMKWRTQSSFCWWLWRHFTSCTGSCSYFLFLTFVLRMKKHYFSRSAKNKLWRVSSLRNLRYLIEGHRSWVLTEYSFE